MIKLFRKKTPEQAIIALDIGTENVKAFLFTVEIRQSLQGEVIGKRAIVKGVGNVPLKIGKMQSSAITDIASVVSRAKEAIRKASDQAGLRPTQLVMGVGGEFIKGATTNLNYSREDNEAKINVSELRNIVHKLQWQSFEKVRRKLAEETGYPEIDVKLVTSSIVSIKIDGYTVTNPMGFQGKEVEMAIFNAFAPLGYYEAFQKIGDELELELLGIVSEPYALSRCLEYEGSDQSAIFIDVGGSGTDIALVDQGKIVGTKMFGIGGRTFTKRLSVELNISFEEAEQLKSAYCADKLEQKSKKVISDIINEDLEVWLEGVVFTLAEFKDILPTLPQKILLCGGGTYIPELRDTLNNRKWYKKLPFAGTPQATYLNPQQIRNVIDETKSLNSRGDTMPLSLVNMGIDLVADETVVQKVLRKVIGIMKV